MSGITLIKICTSREFQQRASNNSLFEIISQRITSEQLEVHVLSMPSHLDDPEVRIEKWDKTLGRMTLVHFLGNAAAVRLAAIRAKVATVDLNKSTEVTRNGATVMKIQLRLYTIIMSLLARTHRPRTFQSTAQPRVSLEDMMVVSQHDVEAVKLKTKTTKKV
jgi:hypothetical protein